MALQPAESQIRLQRYSWYGFSMNSLNLNHHSLRSDRQQVDEGAYDNDINDDQFVDERKRSMFRERGGRNHTISRERCSMEA